LLLVLGWIELSSLVSQMCFIWKKAAFPDGNELYKSTMKYDGDVGREQHGYPPHKELPL